MGNEISSEINSDENIQSTDEYFKNNKKNNNFNKNNSENLNRIYIIQDLDKDSEEFYNGVSGHLMDLDFNDIDDINDDYLFNDLGSNNGLNNDMNNGMNIGSNIGMNNESNFRINLGSDFENNPESKSRMNIDNNPGNNPESNFESNPESKSRMNNGNKINSKMFSQSMVCNNGQCKLRTKECVNGQCRFKDDTFDIRRNDIRRNETLNEQKKTADENTSFNKFIQKYQRPFDSYDKINDHTDENKDKIQPDDKIMNLHLKAQLNNPQLNTPLLPKNKETSPLKEETTTQIKPKYFQDSETVDEDFEPKDTYHNSNYPDNSLSSISDVFWKKSVF